MPPLKGYLTSPGKTAAPQPCVLHQGTAETERQIVREFCLIPISIKAAAAVYRKGGWGGGETLLQHSVLLLTYRTKCKSLREPKKMLILNDSLQIIIIK